MPIAHSSIPAAKSILTDPSAPLHAPINQPITSKPRKGRYYQQFINSGLAHRLAIGELTQQQAADLSDLTQRTINGYLYAYIQDLREEKQRSNWKLDSSAKKQLSDFSTFRRTFFRTAKHNSYLTPPFQLYWIERILYSLSTGSKLTILSPPRHGKTELLIHFCIFLIIKNPNIRILWVGGSEDIAQDATNLILRELETNELLLSTFLPPSSSFKPAGRSSLPWTKSKFTVSTSNIPQKSATLRALGRGSKVLSLDVDLIITDDIDDAESTVSPTSRENTRTWWDQNLTTRKEEHTAWVNIGSRQHQDDIHQKTIDDDTWETIIEQAYNIEADLPLHETPSDIPPNHSTSQCAMCKEWDKQDETLFPQLRTMRYLMTQMQSIGRKKFNMIYLNIVDSSGIVIFSTRQIKSCYNTQRSVLRLDQIPTDEGGISYTNLVGGLDPSGFSGYQAVFIWAFNKNTKKLFMLGLEAERGGGIQEARSSIKKYHDLIGLRHWVVEENLYQGAILRDEILMDYTSRNGIELEGHSTYGNKWDPEVGVTSLAPLFDSKLIDLPYADSESQAQTDQYRRQLIVFEGVVSKSQKKKKATSDLVMASWFPMVVYKREISDFDEEIEHDYDTMPYPTLLGDHLDNALILS